MRANHEGMETQETWYVLLLYCVFFFFFYQRNLFKFYIFSSDFQAVVSEAEKSLVNYDSVAGIDLSRNQ